MRRNDDDDDDEERGEGREEFRAVVILSLGQTLHLRRPNITAVNA